MSKEKKLKKNKQKEMELICPWIWEECPKCGYALIQESKLRDIGIRECARCDFMGKILKPIYPKIKLVRQGWKVRE